MFDSRRMVTRGVAITCALLLATTAAGVARADNLFADGDGLVPVANAPTLRLGDVCVGAQTSGTILMAIQRSGSGQVYANSAAITVSAGAPSAPNVSAAVADSSILLPGGWVASGNNTISSDTASSTATATGAAPIGAKSATILYSASSSSLTRTALVTVEWTVIDCVPADTTPPDVAPVVSGTLGNDGWYTSDVDVSWDVTDPDSAISSTTGCDPVQVTVDTAGDTFTCSATSAGGTTSESVTVKRDATDPTVELVGGPADLGMYYFGYVPGAPTCTLADAMSGPDPAGCSISGYSTALGDHTVIATGDDVAGNSSSASASYSVLAWTALGFHRPVDMGYVNTVKGGSTVPLKFEVFAGPTELTHVGVVQSLSAVPRPCAGGDALPVEELAAAGSTLLRYDETEGQFVYNWKTPKKPGTCYQVTLTLADGSTIVADFQLK